MILAQGLSPLIGGISLNDITCEAPDFFIAICVPPGAIYTTPFLSTSPFEASFT